MFICNRVNKEGRKYQLRELMGDNPSTRITTGEKSIIVNHDIHILSQSWYDWIILGIPVQLAFNYLSDSEREFIMTSITQAEWTQIFGGAE